MANTSSASRTAAYLFLFFFFGALIAYGGYKLYNKYGPSKVVVGEIPFGLKVKEVSDRYVEEHDRAVQAIHEKIERQKKDN